MGFLKFRKIQNVLCNVSFKFSEKKTQIYCRLKHNTVFFQNLFISTQFVGNLLLFLSQPGFFSQLVSTAVILIATQQKEPPADVTVREI